MTRRLAVLAVLVCFSAAPARPARAGGLPRGDARDAGLSTETLGRIQALLDEAASAHRIAGGSALIARRGKTVLLAAAGKRDIEANLPFDENTIVRIASMTKPITSVAVMILADEGKLRVDEPVSKYLPEFRDMKVMVPRRDAASSAEPYELVPAERPITIHHLLTHTSGLSYRFANPPHLGRLYAEAAISDGLAETPGTIGDNVKRLARLPLHFQPGTAWEYGLNTDVLGRLVEVVSGQSLADFFRTRIFEPLKMTDTAFVVPPAKRDRLAAVYTPGQDGVRRVTGHPVQAGPLVYSPTYSTWDDGTYYSGGAGLAATIGDYARFCQMLAGGGELDGVRLLRRETVAQMTRDQLGDLQVPNWGHGDRFGYGFGVVVGHGEGKDPAAVGTFSWGGFFYTYFWVDPKNDLIGILFTQTYPSADLKLREDLKRLTYEALEK